MEEGKAKTAITVAVLEEDMARTMESYLVGICVDDYMISRFEFDGKFLFLVLPVIGFEDPPEGPFPNYLI